MRQREIIAEDPDLAAEPVETTEDEEFEIVNSRSIIECFCDDKLDQFDLEERLLGDEVEKMPFDDSDEDYFKSWR
ncbi:MAG: hypothetical protein Q4E46_03545 [Candidatus Saccharibacteria bacterium]|nr:hypothetical protein [Candidatus Saccharibacteria bacterium]